jgi:hypothetical protein
VAPFFPVLLATLPFAALLLFRVPRFDVLRASAGTPSPRSLFWVVAFDLPSVPHRCVLLKVVVPILAMARLPIGVLEAIPRIADLNVAFFPR